MGEQDNGKKPGGLFSSLKSTINNIASSENLQKVSELASNAGKGISGAVSNMGQKAGEVINAGKDKVVSAIDVNGSGEIDIEDFIILGLRTPGIGINRASFLRAEFQKKFPKETIDLAIETTPAHAGITVDEVNKFADQVIAYERNCVTGISTALSMPGGAAMVATLPSDMIQYYGFMLRAAQKLLYLYGFPEINVDEKDSVFDSETLNMLTLCLGVMFGVAGANKALRAMANALARGVEKKLLNAALTKGTIYPIVKNVAKWFGKKMTKDVFAGFFKKAIPLIGGAIGGAMTFLSFGPCCSKLKESLQDTILSNPAAIVDEEALSAVISGDVIPGNQDDVPIEERDE